MKGMKCVKCGKAAKATRLRLEGALIPGWKCACGEEYLDSEAVERLLALRKLAAGGLTARVTRQGNSFAVRLPMRLFNALGLKNKEELTITVDASKPNQFTLALPN